MLNPLEQFLDRGLACLLLQRGEQISLQRLTSLTGALAQDPVDIRRYVLDLHRGHSVSLAPFWRHCVTHTSNAICNSASRPSANSPSSLSLSTASRRRPISGP